jgi:hypothetical protein
MFQDIELKKRAAAGLRRPSLKVKYKLLNPGYSLPNAGDLKTALNWAKVVYCGPQFKDTKWATHNNSNFEYVRKRGAIANANPTKLWHELGAPYTHVYGIS